MAQHVEVLACSYFWSMDCIQHLQREGAPSQCLQLVLFASDFDHGSIPEQRTKMLVPLLSANHLSEHLENAGGIDPSTSRLASRCCVRTAVDTGGDSLGCFGVFWSWVLREGG